MDREKIRINIKNSVKKIILKYKRYNIGNDWKRFAKQNSGEYKLTKSEIEQFDDLYHKYGNRSYMFAEYYASNTGKYNPRYIPDDLYYNYIDRYFNDWDMATLFDNKCFYEQYFPNVKHPKTVAKRINNIWFDDNSHIISFTEMMQLLNSKIEIFIKVATESDGGHGVYYLHDDEINAKTAKIVDSIKKDIIIQLPIVQHKALSELNPSSVNSIRVLTLLSQKNVKVYSSLVRIGGKGSKVDNNSSGGISCGIDAKGMLKGCAFTGNGRRIDNFEYAEHVIPGFENVLNKAKELACKMPYFRLISWDFAIDENEEPILIEANFKYGGIDFHQLNNGPLFGEDAPKILEEVFSNQNLK